MQTDEGATLSRLLDISRSQGAATVGLTWLLPTAVADAQAKARAFAGMDALVVGAFPRVVLAAVDAWKVRARAVLAGRLD
jgi:hypothetical protein